MIERDYDSALQDPERFALLAFYILFLVSCLYRLQLYVPFPFSALWRFVLYVAIFYLVVAVLKISRDIPKLLLALCAMVLLTGVHTNVFYGMDLASRATARFGNVLFLAPIASLLLTDERRLGVVFRLVLLVFTFVLISHFFQFWGGSLETLVRSYIAIRGDLIRYMTLVGEPNVGGMLAVLAFIVAMMLVRTSAISISLGSLAVTLVFMSISKAAAIGFVVAAMGVITLSERALRIEVAIKVVSSVAAGVLILLVIDAGNYVIVSLKSVFGLLPGEPTVVGDLLQRQEDLSRRRATAFGLAGEAQPGLGGELSHQVWYLMVRFLSPVLEFVFGSSYGMVGSAAQEVLGPESGVVLPHNSYRELFLAGGVAMLGLTVVLMGTACGRLLVSIRTSGGLVDRCALACFILLSCWMLVYPVIYEPVTGSLFWTLLGYGNSRRSIHPAINDIGRLNV